MPIKQRLNYNVKLQAKIMPKQVNQALFAKIRGIF
jgi:hypothetical protein